MLKKANIFLLIFVFLTDYLKSESKPNIIIVYADDMGWGDVGYHGFKDVATPNIDKLATNGIHFTQGYVSASVCAPSRAGLLTGVYQQRFGFWGNLHDAGIPKNQAMISEMLKKQGYATAAIGKWHLNKTGHPNDRGFDFYYGFLGGSHDYYRSKKDSKKPWLSPILRNKTPEQNIQDSNGYLTEMFSHEAVGFIEKNKSKPFFLYLAYNAVHHPWSVPDSYVERLKDLKVHHEDRRVFAGMVLAMDDGIGQVVKTLEKNNILDNTLIFFISDNGTPRGQGIKKPLPSRKRERGNDVMSTPGPFRGYKGDTYEGGTRVPFLVYWKNKIPAGKVYKKPVIQLDVMPTIMSLFDIKSSQSTLNWDGKNLFPYILGKNVQNPHNALYWRRDDDLAILKDNWKLTWNNEAGPRGFMLFNLAEDKGEFNNLIKKNPQKATELRKIFDDWDTSLPPYTGRNSHRPINRKGIKPKRRKK